jgi:hypothetical protein
MHFSRFVVWIAAAAYISCGATAAWAGPNVLLLWDDDADSVTSSPPAISELNASTQSLVAALEAAGIAVTTAERTQSDYDGDSPVPDSFDVVLHLNGNRTSTIDVMPTSTVAELLDYVQNQGGGFITSENTEAQISIPFVGLTLLMEDLALLDRQPGAPPAFGTITLTPVAGQEGHPLLNGLAPPLTLTGGRMRALARAYSEDPATVILRDEAGLDAAAVRDFGAGRVVTFHHTGNFQSSNTLSVTLQDPEVQRLYVNAVLWADQHAPMAVSIEKELPGKASAEGAPFIVNFSEGVSGLGSNDFEVLVSGGLSVAPQLSVAPISDRSYRVTATGLAGTGTLQLNLRDDDTIVDKSVSQNVLGGVGADNGALTGPVYTVDAIAPELATFTVEPIVVPLGERAEFTLRFSEPMDTTYSPMVRITTQADAVINASPSVAPPDNRVKDGLLALYTFDEGAGDTVYDRSGAGEALDLAIASTANVGWVEGGLSINNSTILLTTGPAAKILDGCKASNEITMEAWLRPEDNTQGGPARIATISAGLNARNVTLEQDGADYEARLRTTTNSTNGAPEVSAAGAVDAALLQHVIFTRNATGDVTIYVNQAVRATADIAGDFSTWAGNYKLAVGNELSQNRPWRGELFLLAIYDRALSAAEVAQNFEAGPVTVFPGDGAWTNATTYTVSMDRATVPADQGGAIVAISEARDTAGNEMPPDTTNIGIISSTLVVTEQPAGNYLREAGQPFQFSVSVAGAIGGLQYQWYKESEEKIFAPVGVNAPVLAFLSLAPEDSGDYYCQISDVQATVQTMPSHLEVVGQLPLGGAALLGAVAALGAWGCAVLRARSPRRGAHRR